MRRSRSLSLLAVAALAAVSVSAPASASGRELEADLKGINEVTNPPQPAGVNVGDPDGYGEAEVKIDPRKGRICWEIEIKRLDPVVAGHIHEAPAGMAGPVVVPLDLTQDDFKKGEAEGCVTVKKAVAKDILAHPHDYYVNVHTTVYPGGAVRGQLEGDDHDKADGRDRDKDHDDHDDHDDHGHDH